MERTEVLDMMGGLKLYGMRSAYDETLATALKRKHAPSTVRCPVAPFEHRRGDRDADSPAHLFYDRQRDPAPMFRHLECAPAGGQDQAAVLTVCRAC